jgi:hypothetical protein
LRMARVKRMRRSLRHALTKAPVREKRYVRRRFGWRNVNDEDVALTPNEPLYKREGQAFVKCGDVKLEGAV